MNEATPARPPVAARAPLLSLNLGRRLLRIAFACALVLLGTSPAFADGGHIALRASSEAYSITLFTAPDPLVAGPIDLSLLVQDPATGQVLGNATATAVLTALPHTAPSPATPNLTPPQPATLHLVLTRAAASNKLLLAAVPVLPAPGSYTVVIHVRRPGAPEGTFTTTILAAPNHRRRTTLLFALVLPLAAVLLFLANQWAKQNRYVRGSHPPTP